ncbi:TetR/AcrR family transcriptional regulator [Loigolactobacillus bifermentans]|uniref:Transcription regulator n=1 Tax=Loigolactobacillus bifermentans DSM 20003 TaxID=1423726 RepID=A0A0R1H4I3_9LACO|nr:TetR/AcrR family transcriptional regulator [Loigolactobacillus bifermentans]KRK39475.1 transcription regulator [Loigolactobacillus bifermentans DSM 20003]QGG61242.1 TetR/AcrR family transcriptional regulator [Loigolactobacillus bifermentans]
MSIIISGGFDHITFATSGVYATNFRKLVIINLKEAIAMTLDKRAQRTQLAIQTAFETLAPTTPLPELTVKKLTEVADINRKTFYLHYNSIDDLLASYVIQISEHLKQILTAQPFPNTHLQPGFIFDQLNALFEEHDAFARTILFDDAYSPFAQKIRRRTTAAFAQRLQQDYPISSENAAIVAHFTINNTLSLFQLSLRQPDVLPKAKLRQTIVRLNTSGMSSFLF